MSALPVPGVTARGAVLGYIPGVVPRQSGELVECGFIQRCPYAFDACRAPVPLRPAGDGRLFRCVLSPDGSGRDTGAWARVEVAR